MFNQILLINTWCAFFYRFMDCHGQCWRFLYFFSRYENAFLLSNIVLIYISWGFLSCSQQVFSFSQKISVNFQLVLRFIQGLSLLLALAGIVVAVILTSLSVSDIFAAILAFIPTGWGILSVSSDFIWSRCFKQFVCIYYVIRCL